MGEKKKIIILIITTITTTIIIIIIIVLIIPGQFIKHHKFDPYHIKSVFTFLTTMGKECSRHDSSYQRHITFALTGCYQLHPHHRLGIITPNLSLVPTYWKEKDG